ncbi:MAG: GNAT family N-acetyltransferase [Sphingomicrobium sp.]
MTEIEICRIGPGNVMLLDRVGEGVFNDPIEADRLAAYLAFPASMLVVARDRGLIIGQVKAATHLHPDKPADLYVDEVSVAPTHQRRGIARRMLAEVERWARERGCADVWLATGSDNAPAQALYRSFAQSKPCLLYFWGL